MRSGNRLFPLRGPITRAEKTFPEAPLAGHSQFKNIMHRKGRQDAVRSKLFGKLSREITVAAKMGLPDPAMNARLRAAILAAKAESVPKDNIDRAIKKASGNDAESYDEMRYEGYGPGGVAVIVEVLTDNRTAPPAKCARPSPRRAAISPRPARCRSCSTMSAWSSSTPRWRMPTRCSKPRSRRAPRMWCRARTATRSTRRTIRCARSPRRWRRSSASRARPRSPGSRRTPCRSTTSRARRCLKLIDALNDQDDVQNVYANFEVSDALVAKMSA